MKCSPGYPAVARPPGRTGAWLPESEFETVLPHAVARHPNQHRVRVAAGQHYSRVDPPRSGSAAAPHNILDGP